jgi:hypothetical protein
MAASAERYRKYATDCLAMASATMTDAHKIRLLAMAGAWKQLADEAELAAAQLAVQTPRTDKSRKAESSS